MEFSLLLCIRKPETMPNQAVWPRPARPHGPAEQGWHLSSAFDYLFGCLRCTEFSTTWLTNLPMYAFIVISKWTGSFLVHLHPFINSYALFGILTQSIHHLIAAVLDSEHCDLFCWCSVVNGEAHWRCRILWSFSELWWCRILLKLY